MRFTCNKKDLSETVGVIQRAVSPKTSLPALEGILLKASKNQLSLYSYDLELGMYTTIASQTEENGEIVLNAKIFSDIVRKLPSETVCISTDSKLLTTIQSGNTQFTILGISATEFPELPSLTDGKQLSIPENILSSMIKQTIYAISNDDTKPILTGSLFEIRDSTLTLVSLDNYRLAVRREKINFNENMQFVVPGKTLSEIAKMLNSEGEDEITLSVEKKHALFKIRGYSLITRLLEGEFIDYQNVLGNQFNTQVRVNVRAFHDSVDRASLLINERIRSYVRCTFESDKIKVKCSTTLGKVYDEVPAQLEGDTFEMGFDNHYLIDALRNTDCDEIRIQLNGPLSPMKIYPAQGESFVFLVLPVRLKSNE